jgi:1-acyl-sn-glycerol-3-phosphate acyltransferase
MRNKIYESDVRYDILKPFVDWCTRRSYKKIKVTGLENLPEDGAVLLAPNHCNTLMDALVVLQSTKDAKVFGARADMFKRPFIAKIMHFVRILPMVKQRDGLRNVLKNHETFEIIVETLENGVPFIMFPEGRHRPAHSLLPLGKGIMRTAVAANEKFGKERPVYIVPVGIEYGDYFRYRSTCLVTMGKPINATELIADLNVENEAQLYEPLRKELVQRMSELITYIPDDENLTSKWSLTKILTAGFRSCDLVKRKGNNRQAIAEIEDATQRNPQKMQEILANAATFDRNRRKAGISFKSLGHEKLGLKCLGKALLAILGLPYFIFSTVACLPMWALALFLRSKIRDKAFGELSLHIATARRLDNAVQFAGTIYDTKLPEASLDIMGRCELTPKEDGSVQVDIAIYDGQYDPDQPTAEVYDAKDGMLSLQLSKDGKLTGIMGCTSWTNTPEKAFQVSMSPKAKEEPKSRRRR